MASTKSQIKGYRNQFGHLLMRHFGGNSDYAGPVLPLKMRIPQHTQDRLQMAAEAKRYRKGKKLTRDAWLCTANQYPGHPQADKVKATWATKTN